MKRTHIDLYVLCPLSRTLPEPHVFFFFPQLVSVKLCGARGDLALVGSSVLDAYTRDPSAASCSCHSERTHPLIKVLFFLSRK